MRKAAASGRSLDQIFSRLFGLMYGSRVAVIVVVSLPLLSLLAAGASIHYRSEHLRAPWLIEKRAVRKGAEPCVLDFTFCVLGGVARGRKDCGNEVIAPQLQYSKAVRCCVCSRVEER